MCPGRATCVLCVTVGHALSAHATSAVGEADDVVVVQPMPRLKAAAPYTRAEAWHPGLPACYSSYKVLPNTCHLAIVSLEPVVFDKWDPVVFDSLPLLLFGLLSDGVEAWLQTLDLHCRVHRSREQVHCCMLASFSAAYTPLNGLHEVLSRPHAGHLSLHVCVD